MRTANFTDRKFPQFSRFSGLQISKSFFCSVSNLVKIGSAKYFVENNCPVSKLVFFDPVCRNNIFQSAKSAIRRLGTASTRLDGTGLRKGRTKTENRVK